jgi:hypothetical protein
MDKGVCSFDAFVRLVCTGDDIRESRDRDIVSGFSDCGTDAMGKA